MTARGAIGAPRADSEGERALHEGKKVPVPAPRPLGKDKHGRSAFDLSRRFLDGLQGLPGVFPVDIDVARFLYGPAKDGYAKKLPFCDKLEGDRQTCEEHGDVEGALVVRHEKIGGRRNLLPAFDGDGDAGRPEHGVRP